MRRRQFLASALGLPIVGAAYARFVEPEWLEFRETNCRLFAERQREPLRLLHLSDLHTSPVVPNRVIERAIEIGLSARPDIICLTGDYVTRGQEFDARWLENQFRRLSSAAPAFASLGNHDGGTWAAVKRGFSKSTEVASIIRAGQLHLLHNDCAAVRCRGRNLSLVGLGDMWAGELDPLGAFPPEQGADAVVVLSHNPDTKKTVQRFRWDLMLSGHTHGGQISLPYFGVPYAPVNDRRYIAGLKPWNDRQIHVTKGVGNLHGVRLNCRPEISYLLLN